MLHPRTLRLLAMLLSAYGLLIIPAYSGPAFLAAISGYLILAPYLSIHVFHSLGIPGLLEHNGACGWGWCAPTLCGWSFTILFWLGAAWLAAWGLARLTSSSGADQP